MKNIILLGLICFSSLISYSQAKKPTIMIVPALLWCNENGYIQKFNNQGRVQTLPDYDKAFLQSSDLKIVINKMQQMMNQRGFPTKDLEQSLNTVRSQSAEDAMLTSKSGDDINESPIDKLKKVAKADIWMEIYWKENKAPMGKKSISFVLKGMDAYTDKPVGNAGSTGPQTASSELAILLEEAVLMYIDEFNAQLQNHFEDMFENGREITLRIKTWGDADLESEDYGDDELGYLIEDWVSDNTVKNRFNTSDATENMMLFEQVRIPILSDRGRPLDARGWAKGLRSYLKELGITAKLMTKGLGEATIVVGAK